MAILMASSASSGDGGFKFLMIAACRGGTGFICPLPELSDGLLVAPWVFRAAQPGPSSPWWSLTVRSQSSLSMRKGPGWCGAIRALYER